jgi:hypothetical protein
MVMKPTSLSGRIWMWRWFTGFLHPCLYPRWFRTLLLTRPVNRDPGGYLRIAEKD